jgi:pimeloyl-ACP methyl ester carboxylesterase
VSIASRSIAVGCPPVAVAVEGLDGDGVVIVPDAIAVSGAGPIAASGAGRYSPQIVSEQLCDVGRGITLCYETFGDPAEPTALLIMGLATQMLAWQEDFCLELAGRGLHVVRFDNRDIGRSTHVEGRPPTTLELLTRSRRPARYTIADMADDAAGLLNALELSPAHVIGASMGGMIAQSLAARHPQLVRSLVSIMSTTGSLRAGNPSLKMYPVLMHRAPRDREGFIAHTQRVFEAIGSPTLPRDLDDLRALAGASYDRGHDPAGPGRQLAAIIASGDRTGELRQISAPTLVIHGSADRLVTPSGGRATARAIRDAELITIAGMGHDLPRVLWPRLIDAIADHALWADRRAAENAGAAGRLEALPGASA